MKGVTNQYTFFTELSCEKVLDIISKQKLTFGEEKISGKAYGKQIEIHYLMWRQAPFFRGTVYEHMNGTMITGHFRVPRYFGCLYLFIRVFSGFIFFISLLAISIVTAITALLFFLLTYVFDGYAKKQNNVFKTKILRFIEEELGALPTDATTNFHSGTGYE